MSPEGAGATPANIPIRNAWYLLLYAWGLAEWRDPTRAASETAPHLLGLLARVLADSTGRLLRRNVARAFSTRCGSIRGIRGKVDLTRTLKRLDLEAGRTHCRFPELTADTPRNRVLRATLHRLAADPRVRGEPANKVAELQRELRALSDELGDVPLVRLDGAAFRRLQLGRNDREYALPLAICALVHRLEMPTETAGDHALAALVRDERTFARVFETFVRNFFRVHLDGYHAGSERLSWPDDEQSALVPEMRTDVSLTELTTPRRRVVIDTKFYRHALVTRAQSDAVKFHSDNIYQMYAYLRTQEDRGAEFRSAAGLLLYPTVTAALDERVRIQGHTLRVATIDLAAPWSEIHDRLVDLAITTR